jgi:hypothetical protein
MEYAPKFSDPKQTDIINVLLNQAFIWAVIKYSFFVAEVMMCGAPVINLASESHKLDSPPTRRV